MRELFTHVTYILSGAESFVWWELSSAYAQNLLMTSIMVPVRRYIMPLERVV